MVKLVRNDSYNYLYRALSDAMFVTEACIRCGGLADTKIKNIKSILQFLLTERKQYLTVSGEPSLEYLRDMPTEDVKKELLSFKGVGPKTVSCVLMFNLHRLVCRSFSSLILLFLLIA